MLTLAIDTSSWSGSLAVLRDASVVGTLGVATGENYSSRLFRHVRYLLEELQLGLDRLDLFAVASGPGSFTGLRIGLTAAKGWAEVFGKPVIGVSVLEAIAFQATMPSGLLVSLMDARRGQVFGAVYERRDAGLVRRGEEWVMTPEELSASLADRVAGQPFVIVSPTPEVIGVEGEHSLFCGAPVERVSPFLATTVGRLGYRRAACGESSDALGLDANYVRRSDAEVKWRE